MERLIGRAVQYSTTYYDRRTECLIDNKIDGMDKIN